jgi:NAD/NADP transhydrogenase beta subunit
MKQLFISHAKLCYWISAALWIVAVVLFFHGGHDDFGSWIGIAGIALALLVADATGKLVRRKKPKD